MCWRFIWNWLVHLAKYKSCVDFVKIVCQFRQERSSRDHVSISPRSCVNFARSSLKFGSDLKNLHRGGGCRERAKTKEDRVFFNSMPEVHVGPKAFHPSFDDD